KEVVQMSMGMDDAHHLQAELIETVQYQLMIAARIDYDGFLGDGVADDGAVALQRTDGKGFADQGRLGGFHGSPCSCLHGRSMTNRDEESLHPGRSRASLRQIDR